MTTASRAIVRATVRATARRLPAPALALALSLGVAAASAAPLAAQDRPGTDDRPQTLVQGGGIRSGGYGAPVVRFTTVKDRSAVLTGGEGGWIVNHRFVLGGAGFGMTTDNVRVPEVATIGGQVPRLNFGYGGVLLGYNHTPGRLVHLTGQVLLGSGGASLIGGGLRGDADAATLDTDAVFVAEPALHVEVNVASFFRVAVGGSWRQVSGSSLVGVSDRDLSGVAGGVTFKFGRF